MEMTSDLRLVTPAPAHPDPIGPGCSVRLRSGGPVMKVDIVAGWELTAYWDGYLPGMFGRFPVMSVRLVN